MRKAIALEYGQNPAPVVSAAGEDALAEKIIAEARRRGIYIAEDAALVAVLGQLRIGEEIPESLYAAVAVLLSWSYWLKGMVPGDEKSRTGRTQTSA